VRGQRDQPGTTKIPAAILGAAITVLSSNRLRVWVLTLRAPLGGRYGLRE